MISISVVIPTIGRQTLIRTLDAIASQVTEADEVIVVADANRPIGETFHAAQDRYRYPSWQWRSLAFVDSFKGIYQSNSGFTLTSGDLILSHSDDDIFVAGAFARMRELAESAPDCPVLFRTRSPRGRMSWDIGDRRLVRNRAGGGSIAVPRRWLVPYRYTLKGSVDYNWITEIVDTAAKAGYPAVWTDDVLMISRPKGDDNAKSVTQTAVDA